MNLFHKYISIISNGSCCLFFTMFSIVLSFKTFSQQHPANFLSFYQAVKIAQQQDPWLQGSIHQQQALESQSIAANTLPDPKVSIAFANIPTESFDFNQENMSQFNVGISQMFPRGDSLHIKQSQLTVQSQQYPLFRQDRQAKVAVSVGSLWLEAFRIQQTMKLINENIQLFHQLVDVAEVSYGSAIGKSSQQDIARAELEVSLVKDKLVTLGQQNSQSLGRMSQWFFNNKAEQSLALHDWQTLNLGDELPNIQLKHDELMDDKLSNQAIEQALLPLISQHPSVKAIEKKIAASQLGTSLVKQKYQPEWGVTANYGYRDDNLAGDSRSDLFSVGVTFDLPLFTENRQDQELKSSISTTHAIKTDKQLLLRQLLSNFYANKGRLSHITKRKAWYQQSLLPQFKQQSEIALNAYTSDTGEFSEVLRAHIAQLDAEIALVALTVEEQQVILEMNYVFVQGEDYTASSPRLNLMSSPK